MNNSVLSSYKLLLYIPEETKMSFQEFINLIPKDYSGNVFKRLSKDNIGRSGGNPTWVQVCHYENGNISNERIALHKEFDYDEPRAAYAEKLWSLLGKSVLKGVRVPDIDIVYQGVQSQPETISYRVLNNDKEDLFLMSTVLNCRYESDKKEMRDHCRIEELLESLKKFVGNEENYEKLEKEVIHTILLDAVSNNGDRHPQNWGVVRDKKTGNCELALFDHSNTFRNLIIDSIGMEKSLWVLTYLKTDPNYKKQKLLVGDSSEKIIKYIQLKYSDYFMEFIELYEEGFLQFTTQLKGEKSLERELLKIQRDLNIKKDVLMKICKRGEMDERS